MTSEERELAIAGAIGSINENLELLRGLGSSIPAVERNVVRMAGTLRALQVQFSDLAIVRGALGSG